MTSRTIDIHCCHCRYYLFSLMPDDRKGLEKDYYCDKSPCKETATADKLAGKVDKIELVKP